MESSIYASLYAITGKEARSSPHVLTGQLPSNSFSWSLSRRRHQMSRTLVNVSRVGSPLTAPPHYPPQMFTHILKAVLPLVVQAHEKRF